MMLDGVTPPPAVPPTVEVADPTWYLVLDVIGTWLGAIGTVAATGIAVWLGTKAVRDQRAQRWEQARAQAERVTIVRQWDSPAGSDHGGVSLEVRNDSNQAITAVRVVTEGDRSSYSDAIAPGASDTVFFRGAEDRYAMAAVEFDDASSKTWVRTSDGDLIRVHRDGRQSSLAVTYIEDRAEEEVTVRVYPHQEPYPLPWVTEVNKFAEVSEFFASQDKDRRLKQRRIRNNKRVLRKWRPAHTALTDPRFDGWDDEA